MGYLEFLRMLKRMGDKLPLAFEIIKRIAADVQELMALFDTQEKFRTLAATAETAEELALQDELGALLVADGATAAINWGAFREMFERLKNSGLLDVLIRIIPLLV